MTKTELLYENHISEQIKNAMTTGNWQLLIGALQHASTLPSSTLQKLFTEVADQMATIIYKNASFVRLLYSTSKITLGDLIAMLDSMPLCVYGLGQLSRNKVDEIAKLVDTTTIALRLQEKQLGLGVNLICIAPKVSPSAYISKSIKPVKEIYELYQWASAQNPKYYDIILDVNRIFEILKTINANIVSSNLDSMLDEECSMQGFRVNHACVQ